MYETAIGMEVHLELCTRSKVFCGCSTNYGGAPNSQACPVCLGLPGSLPVLNKRAVEFAIKASLALNCEVAPETKFDRKNYFYPDLVKGYQISQYDKPIGRNGYIEFEVEGVTRRVGIRRVHLEEDTGKSFHDVAAERTYLDFNRSGVPLIEIVTEPDIRSSAEAKSYLEALREIMAYIEVSDCRIEEGSMRCEANISIRPTGSSDYGILNEIKNIGSLRGVQRALEYEIKRQTELVSSGGIVLRQTRRWNESELKTEVMRTKEEAHDYRYFPEPDLLQLVIDNSWLNQCRSEIPELPRARRERYVRELGITPYDAEELVADRALAQYFEGVARLGTEPKLAANWLLSDLRRELNQASLAIEQVKLREAGFSELMVLVSSGAIGSKTAKEILGELVHSGVSPAAYVKEKGLAQLSDTSEIEKFVEQAIADSPKIVADYRVGKERALTALVGVVMKLSRGKAKPELVNDLLTQKLNKGRL
ncbi:MAG: Asp-tRNA(Asn)/Glu-tRNA(Gln) amidotransferase subunit GatB [Peptococcaceae bacterium]|nr:Asp-tRNA(Asn)/Glu-tRNA(Gln) amidotransferase subunit GatB [Peptococcaceae bacterium]